MRRVQDVPRARRRVPAPQWLTKRLLILLVDILNEPQYFQMMRRASQSCSRKSLAFCTLNTLTLVFLVGRHRHTDSALQRVNLALGHVIVVPALFHKRYDQLQFLQRYDTVLYQRKNSSEPNYIVNRGHEAAVFLKYIVDRYDNLPDISIFVQDDVGEDTQKRMQCLRRDADWGWTNLNQQESFFRNRKLDTFFGQRNWRKCFHAFADVFGVTLPDVTNINTYCCSEFALTRSHIRKHTLDSYMHAFRLVTTDARCNDDSPLGLGAWALEHLHHHVLGGMPLQMNPLSPAQACERFVPYCVESPCKDDTTR